MSASLDFRLAEGWSDEHPLIDFAARLILAGFDEQAAAVAASGEQPVVERRLQNMRRAGHQLLFVSLAGERFVIKVFADLAEGHSFGRRLEFFLRGLLRDPALKSFSGACRLQAAGIPVLEPVACIRTPLPWFRRSVFIYREVVAQSTLGQWLKGKPDQDVSVQVVRQLAEMVRKMNLAGLYQPDFTLGNVLIRPGNDGAHELVLIDTDDITGYLLGWLPRKLRYIASFWFLRRMRFSRRLSEVFLQVYLAEDYRPAWLRLWAFFRKGGLDPVARLKKRSRKNSK